MYVYIKGSIIPQLIINQQGWVDRSHCSTADMMMIEGLFFSDCI